MELGYRLGRKTRSSGTAELRYLVSKNFSLTAGYSSDFGAGVGVLTRF